MQIFFLDHSRQTLEQAFIELLDILSFIFHNCVSKSFQKNNSFQDEIHVEENVPWGEDTLFTLEFREEANKYSIHTCNNMYLQRDGKLVPAVNKVGLSYSLGKRNHLVKQGRRKLLQIWWARPKVILLIVKSGRKNFPFQ